MHTGEHIAWAHEVAKRNDIRLRYVEFYDEGSSPFPDQFVGVGGANGWTHFDRRFNDSVIYVKRNQENDRTRAVILHELTHAKIGAAHDDRKQIHNRDFYREMFKLIVAEGETQAIADACRWPRGKAVATEMGLV